MGLEAKLISGGGKKSENGVGGTPMYQIFHDEIPQVIRVLAKVESENPTGSIKDRAAERIVQELLGGRNFVLERGDSGFTERRLEYSEGLTLLDSSSGNYGVSLAHFGSVYGLKVKLVVPGNIPDELLQKIRKYGVEIIMTDAMDGYHGALNKVRELAKDPSFLYVNQYDNLGNFNAHYDGTGREIWEQTEGEVTHFVAGIGTGGTLIGIAKYLKEGNQDARVYPVHPESDFPGIQGLQPFIDGEVHSNLFMANHHLVDGSFVITTEEVVKYWDSLRTRFEVGMSSGANLAAVIKLIEREKMTKGTIVTVLPDNLDRYQGMLTIGGKH